MEFPSSWFGCRAREFHRWPGSVRGPSRGDARMNRKELRWGRIVRTVAGSVLVVGVVGAGGCLSRPVEPQDTRTTATIVERLTQSAVDKIDILLAIDNSRSMADKQEILVQAVPKLVGRLISPLCVKEDTKTCAG